MCLILLATHAHPRYPLIVAANRDEAYSRPTAPAAFWHDDARIFAGRDLEQGGTWLGLSVSGRVAAITNYRQGVPRGPAMRSRGELTRAFLASEVLPETYLREVERRDGDYNGFSLIVGSLDALWFYSNRGAKPQPIAPGVHGLSNHLLDEPWPKVKRGVAAVGRLLGADEAELLAGLSEILADRAAAPDDMLPSTGVARERERALSASFIAGDHYGTRASTVLLVERDGGVVFRERSFGPGGTLMGEVEERFVLETRSSARAAARAGG